MGFKNDINESESGGQSSRINAAGLINATLEKLWMGCYTAMSNSDYLAWNIKLDSIWAILGGDEPEGKVADKKMNEFDMKIYGLGSLSPDKSVGFESKINPNRAKQYQLLKRKSLYLRRLQNQQGKGTAYQTDDEDDWD